MLSQLLDLHSSTAPYSEQIDIGALAAATSVCAEELGAGQVNLLLGLLVGNVAVGLRRWLTQRNQLRRIRHASVGTREPLAAVVREPESSRDRLEPPRRLSIAA